MGNCYSADHIAEAHEEPQQKHHLETISNRLLGAYSELYF